MHHSMRILCTVSLDAAWPGDAGNGNSHAAERLTTAASSRSSSEEEEILTSPSSATGNAPAATGASGEWSAAPVHYFVMGAQPRWKEAQAWPPPNLARQPMRLLLRGPAESAAGAESAAEVPEGVAGTLAEDEQGKSAALRWRHDVELWKCPKVLGPTVTPMSRCSHSCKHTLQDLPHCAFAILFRKVCSHMQLIWHVGAFHLDLGMRTGRECYRVELN